ncbi:hypothetical protein WJX84_011796 [Apatococcus fuscideae]|uniref:Nitroreductase domain-containing protein n=1 Tax=Apatococcus fuscideae TaxID=2026836 RepID=A0AAW1T1M8_9CHLO
MENLLGFSSFDDMFRKLSENPAKLSVVLGLIYLTGLLCVSSIPYVYWQFFERKKHQAAVAKGQAKSAEAVQLTANASAQQPSSGMPTPEQTFQLMRTRRTIFPRDFSEERVSRQEVERMLEAANWAPTHGRSEPWRYVVLGQDGMQAFANATLEAIDRQDIDPEVARKQRGKIEKKRDNDMLKTSFMIVFGMKRQALPEKRMPEWEEIAATSCAAQNLMLMGTAMNIIGYWSSWSEVAKDDIGVKKFLGLTEEDQCLGVYYLGRSQSVGQYRNARGLCSEKVTWM